MSSCSSCTPASQQAIQQLLQKATKPDTSNVLPDPAKTDSKKTDKPADTLNTEGPRGTALNVSA